MSYTQDHPSASVLVVENDANVLNLIRDYLARAGFDVTVANSGWEALKLLKTDHFDVVISELSVSDMDGCSLREKCVMNPETRDMPFIFVIPEKKPDTQVRALRAGVDDIVTKPFDPIVMVARVQAVLERRHTYEQMVRVDPLTRMLNRTTLQTELQGELVRIKRYGRHASVVLLDIDNFDKVNHDSGTAMGDLMLTCFSGVILTSIRTVDVAGRYAGQRFLLFLPETAPDGAKHLAERMQTQLHNIADSVAAYPLTFTCAIIGVSGDNGITLDSILHRAEDALLEAKKQGPGTLILGTGASSS
jgi:two-component system chemotaxis response regulator CheY